MNPDGTLITTKGKSALCKALETLVGDIDPQPLADTGRHRFLIIDGMAIVQALLNASKFRECIDLAFGFAAYVDNLLWDNTSGRIIFDNNPKSSDP